MYRLINNFGCKSEPSALMSRIVSFRKLSQNSKSRNRELLGAGRENIANAKQCSLSLFRLNFASSNVMHKYTFAYFPFLSLRKPETSPGLPPCASITKSADDARAVP